MIRPFRKGLVAILMLSTLAVFTLVFTNIPMAGVGDDGAVDFYDPDIESYHGLSSGGSVQVSNFVEGSEIFYVPVLLSTNSHKITVNNRSGDDVTIYLFSEVNATEPIRHMTVAGDKKESFTGLTSRFLYMIGIVSDVQTQLDVIITD